MNSVKAFLLIAMVLFMASCAATVTKVPIEQAYQPNYQYNVSPATEKIDVTVGIVAPQFTSGGLAYGQSAKTDIVVTAAMNALRSSFESLLSSKGFNTTGPYDAIDDMTFPEKKGSDFVLYPELDLTGTYVIANTRMEDKGNYITGSKLVTVCDVTVGLSGSVQIIAREPLSNEKMWVKRFSVPGSTQTFPASGAVCTRTAVTREINNAWIKMHEAMYQDIMQGLDKSVNSEEFQMLKRQAADLRAKKTY